MENSVVHMAGIPRGIRKATSFKVEIPSSASPVSYEDEYEKLNSSHHLAWKKLMDEDGNYKTSSFYKKVKCLLISWDEDCDDLHTKQEVNELAHIFEDTFHYKVRRALLNNDPEHLAHVQVAYHIAKFIMDEDGPRTLLLVYYAGHGIPKSLRSNLHGLTLTGKRSYSDDAEEVNDVVWGDIENNFQHTRGDVLEIFDCCYAGDLGKTRQTWGVRSFEFLGACSSGNLTRSPGKESFTTALIWALKKLVKEQTRFTVSELSCNIRQAPDFPEDQVPVQFDRDEHAIERIVLAPLETGDNKEPVFDDDRPQGLLNLNFIFEEPPSNNTIKKFARGLNRVMYKEKMPVNRIVWGGLCSWGGRQPSLIAQSIKLEAVKQFKEALTRRTSKGRDDRIAPAVSPGLQTESFDANGVPCQLDEGSSRKRKRAKQSTD